MSQMINKYYLIKFLYTCVFMIFCFSLQGFSWKTNLALNKKAFLCSIYMKYHAGYAVDGNVFGDSYAHADNSDENIKGWFVVDLGRPYQVEYIILYHRTYCGTWCVERLNNFIVGLSNKFDPQINKTIKRSDYKLCNQYNGSLVIGAIAELQCQDKKAYSRYVIIQQEDGKKYLAIPELEVFGEWLPHYVGCFHTMVDKLPIITGLGTHDCISICNYFDYILAAFQEQFCFCGNEAKHYYPLSECNIVCNDGFYYCGSPGKLSVYEVNALKYPDEVTHVYIGCFVAEKNISSLKELIERSEMTVDACMIHCKWYNYSFFGLQNGTQCFCANHYGRHGVGKLCDVSCQGNASQTCGSSSSTSIYSVNLGSLHFKQSNHCKDGVDLDGFCVNRQCEDGWIGVDCTERYCPINNGDCGIHLCVEFIGIDRIFHECICKEGFGKRFWWDYCLETDKCINGTYICPEKAICINNKGNYECQCLEKWYRYDNYERTCVHRFAYLLKILFYVIITLCIAGVIYVLMFRQKINPVPEQDTLSFHSSVEQKIENINPERTSTGTLREDQQ